MDKKKKRGTPLAERWQNDPNPFKIIEEPEETKKSDEFTIYKADDDKRLVFGWASISITTDGEQLEDRQKDMIDPEDLEEAAYDYVLKFRDTGEEHIPTMRKKGKLVESCVLTAEKQKAMGIPEGTVPIGWWIGFKIEDDDAWARVKNGTYKMFSIEGKANREPVEKHNPYHGADGRFTSGPGGGAAAAPSISPAKAIAEYQNYAYQSINEGLRAGKVEGQTKELVAAMDKAFEDATPTKWSQTVHRADGAATTAEIWEKNGTTAKLPKNGDLADLWYDGETRQTIIDSLVGETFTDKGFMSTSKDRMKAQEFSTGNSYSPYGVDAMVHISVPKGTKAIDLGDDGFITGSGEQEIILNRGSSYKISAVMMNWETGGLDIYADLVTDVQKSRRDYDEYPEYDMWLEENLDATIEEQRAAKEHYRKQKPVAKTFEEILKYNMYHGPDGRFASKNGAGAAVAAKPSSPAWVNNSKQTDHPEIPGYTREEKAEQVAEDTKTDIETATRMVKAVSDYCFSGYGHIRAAQQKANEGKELSGLEQKYKESADDIENFIQRSPKWAGGQLHRGITVLNEEADTIVKAAAEGKVMDMQGLSSWSSDRMVAGEFATTSGFLTGVIFHTNSTSTTKGTSVRHLSALFVEDEVVMSTSARFKATKINKTERGTIHIYVDEV